MATESFFEDLVIDTPESLERYMNVLLKNKPYVPTGPIPKEADEEFIRRFVEHLKEKEDVHSD